jgi:hypothetical protein
MRTMPELPDQLLQETSRGDASVIGDFSRWLHFGLLALRLFFCISPRLLFVAP